MGCRRKADAQELFRVVASESGELVPGAGKPGRGAWLCRGSTACLHAAIHRRAFTRALRVALSGGFEGLELAMCEDVGPQLARGTTQLARATQPGGTAAKD